MLCVQKHFTIHGVSAAQNTWYTTPFANESSPICSSSWYNQYAQPFPNWKTFYGTESVKESASDTSARTRSDIGDQVGSDRPAPTPFKISSSNLKQIHFHLCCGSKEASIEYLCSAGRCSSSHTHILDIVLRSCSWSLAPSFEAHPTVSISFPLA